MFQHNKMSHVQIYTTYKFTPKCRENQDIDKKIRL